MTNPVGSEIYRKHIAGSSNKLQAELWAPTPWVIDTYTDYISSSRYNKIMSWCHKAFGAESDPMRGVVGNWRCGAATVFGYTWLGFDSKDKADQFESHWPDSPHIRHTD